ncbi:MAG: S-layer homology domain-containing protein [Thermoleophilia bacterium]
MHHRGLKVALVAVFTLILVLGFAGIAQAQWSDLTLSIVGDYGITEAQVGQISQGFTDGSWKPYANMPRKQFVKMAVAAYKIPLVNPATPSYSDVPAAHDYYKYVEAATAAGLTNGVGGGKFDPEATITREQAAAIIVRWVAAKNGYDLDTMYSAAESAAILGAFPDASAVGPSLVNEMAFAVDFGIVWGDATGMLAPKKAVTRIQGAAMLIRSWSILPLEPPVVPVVPTKIELTSDDEAENLIGLTHQYTFKVTQADGSAAPGVLVDFDTLSEAWYVGNIQPAAALTNADGEVTVNLISTEIGIQRVSAAVPGVTAIWSTKYWLAIDEVYILADPLSAQNNAGVPHTWEARVVVFGPGPLSTDRQDFYNVLDPAGDPTHPLPPDGEPWGLNDYLDELALPSPYVPRTMAGVPVLWTITDGTAEITDVAHDGAQPAEIMADGQSAWGYTNADGHTYVTIYSEVANTATVTAEANYDGNPYEWLMVNRSIYKDVDDYWDVDEDWEPQPGDEATAVKTWIPHVFGDNDTIIDPAYTYANIGEEFTLTATLEDVYGNPIAGRQVEWFMQGIGHFITDDENTITDPTDPAGNKDIDVTDANGQVRVMVKSFMPGEQIVHAKFRDKGIGGMEGQFMTFDAEVQWFDVNVVTFDDPATEDNEALSWNQVGTTHDFTLHVYGLKLEMDPSIDDPQQQTPYIDTDYPGRSYDGIIDAYDAAYFGGIFLVNTQAKNGKTLEANGGYWVTVQGRTLWVDTDSGISEYDWDQDGYPEPFTGQTGIYLPLAGKDVTFDLANQTGPDLSNLGEYFDGMEVDAVGSYTPETAVTDENGEATVTVTSNEKGPETIEATVDWEHNPHNMSELLQAYAKKGWYAEDGVKIVVSIDDTAVADNVDGELATPINPMYDENGDPNSAHIEVHVYDQFGNDLPDYEVVYLLENIGTTLNSGGQAAQRTYLPNAYFTDLDESDGGDDQNGPAPDADEPTPSSDPYATIVGPGGTGAFYFNQWLGAAVPGASDAWRRNTINGHGPGDWVRGQITDLGFTRATAVIDGAWYGETWIQLMTDGAKAWTLDGYYMNSDGYIVPNSHTGSHIDVQLAEYPDEEVEAGHYKSIVKVMVYAPADGVVIDQTPIWHYQVHKVWEAPVPTTITLSPATDISVAGLEAQTVTATVLDQFGTPVVGIPVSATGVALEGTLSTPLSDAFVTDASGQVNFTWTQAAGDWGVESVTATADDGVNPAITSNASIIQWVYMDGNGALGNLVEAIAGQSKVTVYALFAPWAGMTVQAYQTTGGTVLGSAVYNATINTSISTPTHTWAVPESFFVKAPASSNTDGVVNWVYDLVVAP